MFGSATTEDIVGVTLAGTNIAGLTAERLSFNAHEVFLNPLNLGQWGPDSFVSINVQFAEPGAAVPEPGVLALAGLGLLSLAVWRPRRGGWRLC